MKKIYYWFIGIALVLIITNPTFSDFENHLPSKNPSQHEHCIKLNNYFIASVYIHDTRIKNTNATFGTSDYYLGILGNFFRIGSTHLIADHFTPVEDMVVDTGKSTITVDTVVNIKTK